MWMSIERDGGMIAVTKPLFTLGKVLATPGAIEALAQTGQSPWELLSRHLGGDWGTVDAGDKAANEQALRDGSRILSSYLLNDGVTKIWLITEAEGDNGQRAATTLLLPNEY
jgi:hypothetical protein